MKISSEQTRSPQTYSWATSITYLCMVLLIATTLKTPNYRCPPHPSKIPALTNFPLSTVYTNGTVSINAFVFVCILRWNKYVFCYLFLAKTLNRFPLIWKVGTKFPSSLYYCMIFSDISFVIVIDDIIFIRLSLYFLVEMLGSFHIICLYNIVFLHNLSLFSSRWALGLSNHVASVGLSGT